MANQYVYGIVDESLIFIRSSLAEQLDTLRSGFGTWGDARAGLDPSMWDEISDRFTNSDEDVPGDAEQFDLEAVPGVADGDWPAWPAALMAEEMPEAVRQQFGTIEDSVLNGQFLTLEPQDEASIVKSLESHGWVCTRDDDLVRRACGFQ